MIPASRRLRLAGLAILAVAALLTVLGVPVTSAQGTVLFVADATGPLPVDEPWSEAWDRSVAVDVPLSGQAVTAPMLIGPSIAGVRVRAMTDDERFAVLIEWQDATPDDSVLAADTFADAVAIQFALGQAASVCMGQLAGALNIWHWKADWAADLGAWRDVQDVNPNMPLDASLPHVTAPGETVPPGPPGFLTARDAANLRAQADRPSSVEDLNAVGFGTLTSQPLAGQNVRGASEYRDGTWRVVLSRSLATDDPNDTRLGRGRSVVIALAVWDGARGDRDGQKSVSSWLTLGFAPKRLGFVEPWFLGLILLVLGISAAIFYAASRMPAVGLGWPGGSPQGGGSAGGGPSGGHE